MCLCTLLAGALHAAERRYYFDDNNSVQGLAQHTVHAFFQDRTGYIWIGTQGGLHKYDGYTYQLFRHVAGDSDSLPDSFVTALAQDGEMGKLCRISDRILRPEEDSNAGPGEGVQ